VEVMYTASRLKTRSQLSESGGANAHNLFLVALVVEEGTSRLASRFGTSPGDLPNPTLLRIGRPLLSCAAVC